MLLALRSGIDSEIGWALDRLCRLCNNEQFLLNAIPGLTDALFEWPEWFIEEHRRLATEAAEGWEGGSRRLRTGALFSLTGERKRKIRHALESIFILRNSALNEPNARELASHKKTKQLVLDALRYLAPTVLGRTLEESEEPSLEELALEGNMQGLASNWDEDPDSTEEFLLHAVELLQEIAPTFILPPPSHFDFSSSPSAAQNPAPTLAKIANVTNNRTLIIASLTTLTALLSNIANASHLSASSPALIASIRYLPLFNDKPLLDACLNYLYGHLSHPPIANAFLLHPDMPSMLRLLVSFIISEQVDETATVDITAPKRLAPSVRHRLVNYELMGEELERIGVMPEPERCYQWFVMEIPVPVGPLLMI
jgi:chromatin structure-remodeling complex subunit RSC9